MGELAVIAKTEDKPTHYRNGQTFGRPTLYSDAIATLICDAVEEGTSLIAAARIAGITQDTLYTWAKTREDFPERLARARGLAEQKLSRAMYKAAEGDPEYKGDPRAAMEVLKRQFLSSGWGEVIDIRKADTDTIKELLQQQADSQTVYEPIEPGEDDL